MEINKQIQENKKIVNKKIVDKRIINKRISDKTLTNRKDYKIDYNKANGMLSASLEQIRTLDINKKTQNNINKVNNILK